MREQKSERKKENQKAIRRLNKDPQVKQSILRAAAEAMNRRGCSESSISEIASAVGIKDPVIYQYFRGKEELLFAVVEDHMVKFLQYLNEQLQGISGAYNKLRKLIWAHLHFNDINRDYITLVNLECRSNLNFYRTKGYQLIRHYAGILSCVLREGVEEGAFRPAINMVLVRDLIFGLVDFEAITCLITKEINEATPDHGACMRLIERILTCNIGKNDKSFETTRCRILRSAIRAFAEKGYTKATISEIAKQAGVADGTVYEYFTNKEELLLCIPEQRFEEHINQLEVAFNIKDPVKMLRRFIKYHFNLYLTDTDFLKVYLSLILLNRRFYQSRAYDGLRRYLKLLEDIIQKGIDAGSFAPDTDIRIFRNMFLGAFTHMGLRWFFLGKQAAIDKTDEINQVTNLLSDAVIA
ncbi:MAG: TetR family transcriptional regulator [Deltaproteobacteria bacterium]|nr:TetR family transcriptional regulator [Deltaproteobacteria bacterium]